MHWSDDDTCQIYQHVLYIHIYQRVKTTTVYLKITHSSRLLLSILVYKKTEKNKQLVNGLFGNKQFWLQPSEVQQYMWYFVLIAVFTMCHRLSVGVLSAAYKDRRKSMERGMQWIQMNEPSCTKTSDTYTDTVSWCHFDPLLNQTKEKQRILQVSFHSNLFGW